MMANNCSHYIVKGLKYSYHDAKGKNDMSVARGEQETIIRRDKDGLHAWSDIPSDIRQFRRQGWTVEKEDRYGVSFSAPDHAISIKPAVKRKRQMSDEQKRALTERLYKKAV